MAEGRQTPPVPAAGLSFRDHRSLHGGGVVEWRRGHLAPHRWKGDREESRMIP